MGAKEFLRPEWKKLVLPVVFIVLFAVVINFFFEFGRMMDDYVCGLVPLFREFRDAMARNDTVAGLQANEKVMSLAQNMADGSKNFAYAMPVIYFITTVDPLVPGPCETVIEGYMCGYYSSRETYDCEKTLVAEVAAASNTPAGDRGLFTARMPEYREVSFAAIGLSGAVLFLEGYLISCAVLWAYRRFRAANIFRRS